MPLLKFRINHNSLPVPLSFTVDDVMVVNIM